MKEEFPEGFFTKERPEATEENYEFDPKTCVPINWDEDVVFNPKWIPCSEKMPEEHEWIGTKDFGTTISDEVYVTFESPKGERFCKHLSFQNGKLSSYDQRIHKGVIPIAWMPLPEPYRG